MQTESVSRKEQAEYLLNHPMFDGAFRELGEFYNQGWFNSSPSEAEAREEYYRRLHVLKDIKAILAEMIVTGAAAQDIAGL